MSKSNDLKTSGKRFKIGVSDFSSSEPLMNAELIIASGMDFIEPGLAKIAAMPENDFEDARKRIQESSIHVQSVNWFLPPELKVTGPDTDNAKLRGFLEHALARAVAMGASAVVFGSRGSRSTPTGFSQEVARNQMVSFCRLCSDVILENKWPIRIAIEHVNHTETNFVNSFREALSIARQVDRKEIGLAADFYHFAVEGEAMDVMLEAAEFICAVQLADPNGRKFPVPETPINGLASFMHNLTEIDYLGGVSVEAFVGDDLRSDCESAVQVLTSLMKI